MLLAVMLATVMKSQIRGNDITVSVVPDRLGWTYKTGETATFNVSVCQSGVPLPEVAISYEAGAEMYPDVKKEMTLKDGTARISGKMQKPGFYRLTVTARVKDKEYRGWGTAAFSPEKITPKAQCPSDFDVFWTKAISDARHTALEPTMQLLPERSTPDVSTYHVSFQNDRWGRRVYGILNVPTAPGRYPALLKVPGAGVRPYTGDASLCKQGIVVLEIGIHGIPVTNQQSYYDQLFTAALADYWTHGSNNPDRSYYKHVVTGCIRAIDFISTLPSWDGANLAVTGSSQGGFLTLATTALDPRVSCYGAVHAAMCDHEASLSGTACGWPHMFYNIAKPDAAEVSAMRYYDGVNFARRIKVPGWYSFGYNDDVVPPTTAWATYNAVSAEKTISPYQQTAHFWYQEQYDEWFDWLVKKLKRPTP